jgi:hypothetical protein
MVRVHPDPPYVLSRENAVIEMYLRIRGISSAGRAPALQAGGRRFDPVILHQKSQLKSTVVMSKKQTTRV